MKIQYQIFEMQKKNLMQESTGFFGQHKTGFNEFTVLEPYFGLNSFDSIEEAVQYLSTLEKGKYTILTVYEI